MKGNPQKKVFQDNFIKHWVKSSHNHPQGWKWWKRRTRKRFRKSQKEEAGKEYEDRGMVNRRCCNCKYIGAETGEGLEILSEMQSLHFCENDKSIFKFCVNTATGCNEFEPQESEDDK